MQEAQKALRSYATVLLRKWERLIQRLNGKTKDDLPKLLDYDIVEEMGRRGESLSPLSTADWKALYEALATFIRRLANMQDRILDENYAAIVTMFQLIAGSEHDSEYEGMFTKRGTWSVIRSFILTHDPQENIHLMIFFLTLLLRRRSCSCCQARELIHHGDELCAQLQKCFEFSNKASPYMKFQLAFCVTGVIMPCLIQTGPDPSEYSSFAHMTMVGRLLSRYNLLRLSIKLLDPDQNGQDKSGAVHDLSVYGRYVPFATMIHKELNPLSETKEFVNRFIRLIKKCKDTMPLLVDCLIGEMEKVMHSNTFSETFLPQLVESLPRNSLKSFYAGVADQFVDNTSLPCQFGLARGFYRVGRFDAHFEVARLLFHACAREDMVITREEWDLLHHEFAVPTLQKQYFEPLKREVSEHIFNKRMLILEDMLIDSWKPFTARLSNKCSRSPEIRFVACPNTQQKYLAMIIESEFVTCVQCGYQSVRNGLCLRRVVCGYKTIPVGVTIHRDITLDGRGPLPDAMLDEFKAWTEEPSKPSTADLNADISSDSTGDSDVEVEFVELGNLRMRLPRSKLLGLKEKLSPLGEMKVGENDIVAKEMKEEYEKLSKHCDESAAKAARKKLSVGATDGYKNSEKETNKTVASFPNDDDDDDMCKVSVFRGMKDAVKHLKADAHKKKPIKVVEVDTSALDKLTRSPTGSSISKNNKNTAEANHNNNGESKANPAKIESITSGSTLHDMEIVESMKAAVEEEGEKSHVGNNNGNHSTFAMECTYCGRVAEDLMLCGQCQQTRYCNRICQKADWKRGHKAECNINNGS